MAQTYEFYRDRADEAAVRAEEAQLDNVRERELRAEKSWRALANQAQAVARDRAKAEEERAARRAAEAEEAAKVAEAAEVVEQ